jgi:hypothetical protein
MEGNEAVVIPNAERKEQHHLSSLLLKVGEIKVGDPEEDKQ